MRYIQIFVLSLCAMMFSSVFASDGMVDLRQDAMEDIESFTDSYSKPSSDAGYAKLAKKLAQLNKDVQQLPNAFAEMGHDTKAKPAIWQNKQDFDNKISTFVNAFRDLQTAAENKDSDAVSAQYKIIKNSCRSCHKQYKSR